MRFHREWPLLQLWANDRRNTDIFDAENLVLARVESVMRRDLPGVALDLRFEKDGLALSIPAIYIDEFAMITKLKDVCIWPEAIAHRIPDAKLAALEAHLYPWLEFAITGRGANEECYQCFGDEAAGARFNAARKAGFLGAAPLALAAPEVMLALFAGRFAFGAQLLVAANHVAAGALLSNQVSAAAFPDMPAAARTLAQEWFGIAFPSALEGAAEPTLILGAELGATAKLAPNARIIDTKPHPNALEVPYVAARVADDLFRVGERVAGTQNLYVRTAASTAPTAVLAPPNPVGGSSGNIVMVIRRNAYAVPGADVEEAQALAAALRSEGFTVELCTEMYPELLAGAGIVHGFGLQDPEQLNRAIEMTKERGTPFVLTPFFEDPAGDSRWGIAASRALLGSFEDEADVDRALLQLAERRVEVDGITAQGRTDDGADAVRREVLRRADVVTVTSAAERDAIQRFSGRRRRTLEIGVLVSCEPHVASITHLIPDGPFVCVDSNADGRHNLGILMRALRTLDLPTVALAPAVDRRLVRLIQAESHATTVILSGLSDGEREALYARAAVYVDAAWSGDGSHRLFHAAAHGAILVVAQARHMPQSIAAQAVRIDPAALSSIRSGIATAWQRSRDGEKIDVTSNGNLATSALRSYVAAYAQASEHLGQAVANV